MLEVCGSVLPHDPHVKEHVINFMHLEQTNATMISRKILESLSDPSISLDSSDIRVVSHMMELPLCQVEKEGPQAKIKEISLLALFTQCYAHYLNFSIATTCIPSEVQNLIGLINEHIYF